MHSEYSYPENQVFIQISKQKLLYSSFVYSDCRRVGDDLCEQFEPSHDHISSHCTHVLSPRTLIDGKLVSSLTSAQIFQSFQTINRIKQIFNHFNKKKKTGWSLSVCIIGIIAKCCAKFSAGDAFSQIKIDLKKESRLS